VLEFPIFCTLTEVLKLNYEKSKQKLFLSVLFTHELLSFSSTSCIYRLVLSSIMLRCCLHVKLASGAAGDVISLNHVLPV
jgi:hypothetical protein